MLGFFGAAATQAGQQGGGSQQRAATGDTVLGPTDQGGARVTIGATGGGLDPTMVAAGAAALVFIAWLVTRKK